MRIPVVGLDPSMNHWGLASSQLDLATGYLDTPDFLLVEPEKANTKQVRVNSSDLGVAYQLAKTVMPYVKAAKVVFVEIPVGSQSARGMAAYGICVGILGSMRAEGVELIEVTAAEVKLALSGNKNATKTEMVDAAMEQYPEAVFPSRKGRIIAKAEHVADALGAIHAGVNTPIFKNLLKLFN